MTRGHDKEGYDARSCGQYRLHIIQSQDEVDLAKWSPRAARIWHVLDLVVSETPRPTDAEVTASPHPLSRSPKGNP